MCAFCAGKSHLPRLVFFKERTGWEAAVAHVLPFKPFPFRNCLSGVGHRPLREDRTWWKRVEERERERERTTNPQIVASCRCVQYPRKKKKKKKKTTHTHTLAHKIASVEICRASTQSRVPAVVVMVMMRKKQRCIHGAVTHPKHLYIPLTAQGVLLCGGYITSRTAEEAKRQQHRAAHAHKHTRKTERRKKRVSRRIWQGGEEEGEGGNLVREAPQGEEEKKKGKSKLFGSRNWALCDYDKPIVRTGWE